MICRAAESIRGGWGSLSITTGLLGDDGPIFQGNLFDGLPHGQYAYLEVHHTGTGPRTASHRVVEEPFLSSQHPDHSMRLSTIRLPLHNQGGEVRLQSRASLGTSIVLLLPYCVEHGLERL